MKKLIYCVILYIAILSITGCNQLKPPINNKTTFYLNEEGKIDSYKITLNDIMEQTEVKENKSVNGIYLILEFKIQNISDKEQIIIPNSFKLNIDQNDYIDLNNKADIKIPSKESIMYKVVYDVPNIDKYNINFYSGIVSNNITFITN